MESLGNFFFLCFQTNQVFNIHLIDDFYLKNNGVLARYSPQEIRGRILAAKIPRDLGRLLAAEIQKSRQDFGRRELGISASSPRSHRDPKSSAAKILPRISTRSRRDLGKTFVQGRLRLTRLMLGLQRFQVVVKSHPLGKNSSPLLNSVLLPIRFGCLHTLHFSNITLFSTQNSLLITS